MSAIAPFDVRFEVPHEVIYRFSMDEYHDLVRSGVLSDDAPVEFLEGWLVQKMPKNPPHRLSNRVLGRMIDALLPPGWHINIQESISTATSEPEPDAAVIRGQPEDYRDRHPAGNEVTLVGEVSDTTLQRDRTTKMRIYAAAAIPIYWIVNLVERQIEVYTQPSGPCEQPDYQQRQDYLPGDAVPLIIDGQQLAMLSVNDILQ